MNTDQLSVSSFRQTQRVLDETENTAVAAAMTAMIPTASPIQKWRSAEIN